LHPPTRLRPSFPTRRSSDLLTIEATADGQAAPGAAPARFVPSRQKQRASLLLTKVQEQAGSPVRKTLFVGFGMTHEEHDPTHGWLIAYDVGEFRRTAAWCMHNPSWYRVRHMASRIRSRGRRSRRYLCHDRQLWQREHGAGCGRLTRKHYQAA